MRSLRLALLILLFGAAAHADERAAMSTQGSSFELFGRKVCYVENGARCDVALVPNLLASVPAASEVKAKVWRFLGINFCSEPRELGPACDVVWVPPTSPAVAWRDIRMGVLPGSDH